MNHALDALLALVADALIGDPPRLYRRCRHPVAWIGALVVAGEQRWNHGVGGARSRMLRGALLTWLVVVTAAAAGALVAAALGALPGATLLSALAASTLIAARSLDGHARAVAVALAGDLDAARAAVAHVVGRDPRRLDRAAVARATVESVAENFTDAVVAPLLWYALGGLPALAACKAVNTLDSMIGHRTPRYLVFGRVAARLDDLVNWVPARIAGVLLVAAAVIGPGGSVSGAWHAMRRDAGRHLSPNAGWTEAAMAGALGFARGGPRRYAGDEVAGAWMGDGRRDLGSRDVHRALALYRGGCVWGAVGLALWVTL